jgi:2'-5' RNA ligase
VATVERSDRLAWLQQKVRRWRALRHRGRAPQVPPDVTLALSNGAETGHHLAQFMASHSPFGPARGCDHFALYSAAAAAADGSIPKKRAGLSF